MGLRHIVTSLMTESDNRTHDLFRYLALAAALVGLGLQIYVVIWKSQPFDIQPFGIGVGVLLAGVGAALALRPESKGAVSAP